MTRKTYKLKSSKDIDGFIEAAVAALPVPPAIPKLPSISPVIPQTQREREEELRKIEDFFRQCPDIFSIETKARTWGHEFTGTHPWTLEGPDAMSGEELARLSESAIRTINQRTQEIDSKFASQLNSFMAQLNRVNGRVVQLKELLEQPQPKPLEEQQPVDIPVPTISDKKEKTKTTWYYYDMNGDKVGPFTATELKALAQRREVMPGHCIENDKGDFAIAKNVKGLTFPEPLPTEAKTHEMTPPEPETIPQEIIEESKAIENEVENDITKTIEAAEQGDAEAQYQLGECYATGKGVSQDKAESMKWYQKAAEQGHAEAMCALGYCYALAIPKNYVEAKKWGNKAKESGSSRADGLLKHIATMEVLGQQMRAVEMLTSTITQGMSGITSKTH